MTQFILPLLTIPNGQTTSNVLTKRNLQQARSLVIGAPATLPETVSIEVAFVDGTPANWQQLQSNAADIIIAADKAVVLTHVPFVQLRLVAGGAVAADRIFSVNADDE